MARTDGAGGWPHDPDGDAGSEGMRKYGLAIVAKKVEEADFPLDVAEFLQEYGDHPVRLNHERVVRVADVFESVGEDVIEDKVTFNAVVGDAMRRGGYWNYQPAEG